MLNSVTFSIFAKTSFQTLARVIVLFLSLPKIHDHMLKWGQNSVKSQKIIRQPRYFAARDKTILKIETLPFSTILVL